jgi:hypothetical protein
MTVAFLNAAGPFPVQKVDAPSHVFWRNTNKANHFFDMRVIQEVIGASVHAGNNVSAGAKIPIVPIEKSPPLD